MSTAAPIRPIGLVLRLLIHERRLEAAYARGRRDARRDLDRLAPTDLPTPAKRKEAQP